jgi:hypothetical protein
MNRLFVEVEPLSEERWVKVERSLMTSVERTQQSPGIVAEWATRSPWRRTWLAAAAVVAALAVLVLAKPWASEELALDQPSRIATGHSPSHLALPGLALDVEPHSAVVVGSDAPDGLLLVLDRGSIVCRVAKRSETDPFIVQAGGARIRVVGTRFAVTRLGESARVDVYEGVVEVVYDGKVTRVTAGQHWPREEVAVQRPIDGEGSGMELVPHGEPPSVQRGSEGRALSSSEATGEDKKPGRGSPAVGSLRIEPRSPANGEDKAHGGRNETERPGSHEIKREPDSRPSAQALFEQATTLERSDPARASQLYAELQSGTDSWAQNALYARGRLEATRGNRDLARRLLGRYLERFPHGGNAEDARAVLGRLK